MKVRRPTQPHISGKNSLGRFMVRRKTIRKRMRVKLREIKQQLRKRMHDPVRQTGQWLKSVVQGHFNYYAVSGNSRVCVSEPSRSGGVLPLKPSVTGHAACPGYAMASQPRALHPFPDVRFAATHPR